MKDRKMLIDAAHPEETRVAIMNGDQLDELDIESSSRRQLKGNIYLAKVIRVEPSLQAAFVDYGGNRHGFLAFSDIHPDYYQIPIGDREQIIAEDEEARAETSEFSDDHSPDIDLKTTTPSNGKIVETIGGDDIDEVEDRRQRKSIRRYKIQEVIKRRQILLIQVVKEERGNKGAALTTYLSLAGRYCVLMPNTGKGGGISRRISNANDRKRLKDIVSKLDILSGMALIVRTAGAERTKAEIKRDYEFLIGVWNDVRNLTMESAAPTLIHEEANIIKRALRDMYARDIDQILVEGDSGYRMAKDLIKKLSPSNAKKVQPYKDSIIPIFSRHKIESQLDSMISGNVKLKSGGYLVISSTEALVAIDVNSGRATRGRNIEETALKTNLEAASEIARQLRLRDLAGLVVIDFIDMEVHKNQFAVERRLKETMRRDRAKIQIGRISPFGLLELSRQRLRPSIVENTTDVCSFCNGSGFIRSIESTVLHVLRGIEENGSNNGSSILVYVPNDTGLYMLNHKRDALAEIERKLKIKVVIEEDKSLISPEFRIEDAGSLKSENKVSGKGVEHKSDKKAPSPKDEQHKRKRRRSRQRSKKNSTPNSEHLSKSLESNDIVIEGEDKSQNIDSKDRTGNTENRKRRRNQPGARKRRKNSTAKKVQTSKSDDSANLEKSQTNRPQDLTEPDFSKSKTPEEKSSIENLNVTVVGSNDEPQGVENARRGWWQKLVE